MSKRVNQNPWKFFIPLVRITSTLSVVLFLLLGLAGRSQAQYAWQNVPVPGGGFVAGLVYSRAVSGLIYARADIGGFYRWDSATSLWIPLTDMYGISQVTYFGGESIAPDPTNANIVYAAAGMYEGSGNGVILSSTNQGNTWTINSIPVPMGGNEDGRQALFRFPQEWPLEKHQLGRELESGDFLSNQRRCGLRHFLRDFPSGR